MLFAVLGQPLQAATLWRLCQCYHHSLTIYASRGTAVARPLLSHVIDATFFCCKDCAASFCSFRVGAGSTVLLLPAAHCTGCNPQCMLVAFQPKRAACMCKICLLYSLINSGPWRTHSYCAICGNAVPACPVVCCIVVSLGLMCCCTEICHDLLGWGPLMLMYLLGCGGGAVL